MSGRSGGAVAGALAAAALVAAALVATACGGGSSRAAPAPTVPAPTAPAPTVPAHTVPAPTVPVAGGQGCLGPDSGRAGIAWSSLHNPILSYPTVDTKDEAIHLYRGRWYLLYTAAVQFPGAAPSAPIHWRIGGTTSADLSSFAPLQVWPDQPGTLGLASPDITQMPDGRFVVTYTSIPGDVNGSSKLYFRTSADLVTWSAPARLAPGIHGTPTDRLIDPALAFLDHGVMLGYKINLDNGRQAFEMAWSPSGSLDGPWTVVGRPDIVLYQDTIENYQFLRIDGQWRLVATSNSFDQPWIFTLGGPPEVPASWLHWTGGYELQVPDEAWQHGTGITGANYEHANSAYLCDARALDGHYYLFFTGTSEMVDFGGSGHNAMGIARSTDLVHWQVP